LKNKILQGIPHTHSHLSASFFPGEVPSNSAWPPWPEAQNKQHKQPPTNIEDEKLLPMEGEIANNNCESSISTAENNYEMNKNAYNTQQSTC